MLASLRSLALVLAAVSPLTGCALLDAQGGGPPGGPGPGIDEDGGVSADASVPPDSGFGDSRAALSAWSACMDRGDWVAIGMGAWASKSTEDGQACSNCHDGGQFGIFLHPDSELMFEMNRNELFIEGFFAVALDPDGSFSVVPAFAKLVEVGAGGSMGPPHPIFNTDIDDDLHFRILGDFHAQTRDRMYAGICGPPDFLVD